MKKYTVWVEYGCEGWHPYSYETLTEAIQHDSYGNKKRITIDVDWEIKDITD